MARSGEATEQDFPYSLTISIPLPTHRLASSALRALQVDLELSPLVKRTFRLTNPEPSSIITQQTEIQVNRTRQTATDDNVDASDESLTVLETEYRATTNRMLRVAVNAFMDSLGVVVGVMEELDVDVLGNELGKP
ncbi:Polarized growth chromatin-associated controller 1 [Trichophyton interdigitale]|uniref:Transcription factor Pcc1 n=1 Tax=Trichophyton interdigitale (strain MR816) TaxID=1215338 RepID=A0A059J1Q1_TRIIM|nr:hypothetical protein H101_01635 [Trichophyton interdigitale H6]KAG5207998.1 Transcription factor Pcc1 [Trichophyton interdigitale]KAG5217958.1 Transcription factor Pcc1 [Trichophyton interdigitale]KAG8206433.1 Polarized growth chromatin-associated controller 1 [Trichophyton interdigitale]KDB21811.1 hypothetical protein H109_06271 [Trichophyton interdigitale MR816]